MKFKKRKQRKNITYNTIVIVLTFIMCFLSVGYCAMSSVDVFESPTVLVSPKADVRITNLELSSTSNGGISKSEDYNVDRINGLIDLPNIDSTVTYKVDITVFLSSEMQLDNITGLNPNLTYELVDYNLGEVLCNIDNECNLGAVKELYLVIKYKDGSYDSSHTEYPFELNFEFNPINKAAKIDYTYYNTIQEAIDNVEANGVEKTIFVLRERQELLKINSNQKIKLNFQGYKVTNITERPIIENYGLLTIQNANLLCDSTQGAINNYSGAELKIFDGKVIATGEKQSIYIKGGNAELGGSLYVKNSSSIRASVHNEGGYLTILGGTYISENYSGIYNKGTLTIGTKDGSVNISSPLIIGDTFGLETTKNISFYDGVIKGKTDSVNVKSRLYNLEDDYSPLYETELIDEVLYHTVILDKAKIVTFNPNEGTVNETTRQYEKNSLLGVLPVPTKDDYTFIGWYTRLHGGEKVGLDTVVTDNMELFAHWKKTSTIKIAQIEETGNKYHTLQDAIDAASPFTTTEITILQDTYENVIVDSNKIITFKFGDYTLSSIDNRAVITNYGKVTMISGRLTTLSENNAAVNNEEGEFIISGGSIVAAGQRQAIYNNGGTLTITGTAYLNNSSSVRAAVQNQNTNNKIGKTYITGGTIVSLKQEAVKNLSGELYIGIKNGTIDITTPILKGETYGVNNASQFSFYDGTIKGLIHTVNGNVTSIEDNATTIYTTEVINNKEYRVIYLKQE